jgi:hypothetical protein
MHCCWPLATLDLEFYFYLSERTAFEPGKIAGSLGMLEYMALPCLVCCRQMVTCQQVNVLANGIWLGRDWGGLVAAMFDTWT